MKKINMQFGKVSQNLLIAVVIVISILLAFTMYFFAKSKSSNIENKDDHSSQKIDSATTDHDHADEEAKEKGSEEKHTESLSLTAEQMAEQGIKLAKTEIGQISQVASYPAKLMANTDRQAHVSANFSGRVESVHVELGQSVKKGQALASLFVPELIDQQTNLQIAQSNLTLAQQDYSREQKLWSQGVSAKQDYLRASNTLQQAKIQLQAARSRLAAFAASSNSNGRYVLTAPIAGVISQKDIVIGENVQTSTQLFMIDQLDQLWLEFILPNEQFKPSLFNQKIEFKSLQSNRIYQAQIQTLNTEADLLTGRLQVRAKVLSNNAELRPNLMVNVQLNKAAAKQSLRVAKSAIQPLEEKNVVFVATQKDNQIEFQAQPVELGQASADGQWIEIKNGLSQGQSYVAQGSFLLKSELEKGEASHAH